MFHPAGLATAVLAQGLVMKLITFRVIGHPDLTNQSWLKVGEGLNVIKAAEAEQGRCLLRMLQSINPPYDFNTTDPFHDLPQYTLVDQQTRRIIPAKKTAAMAIFTASPRLVKELAEIDPLFFETDRIEFGRRRDRSRWINFVELANSSRWSEIKPLVNGLVSLLPPESATVGERLRAATAHLRSSDRIRGEIAAELRERLVELGPFLANHGQAELDRCLYALDRAHHFQQARDIALNRLPVFVAVTNSTLGYPDQQIGGRVDPQSRSELFRFLAQSLEKDGLAGRRSLKTRLPQINRNLQLTDCEVVPQFEIAGGALSLYGMWNGAVVPFLEMPLVERLEMLLEALAAIHQQPYGVSPIFMIDISEMSLDAKEHEAIHRFLLCHSWRWQSLVIADSRFLALAKDTAPADKDGRPAVSILEINPE